MAVGNSFGAGISAKDNAAMLLAALAGHDGMIRFLLQHEAKLGDWVELALLMAEQNGHSETASPPRRRDGACQDSKTQPARVTASGTERYADAMGKRIAFWSI